MRFVVTDCWTHYCATVFIDGYRVSFDQSSFPRVDLQNVPAAPAPQSQNPGAGAGHGRVAEPAAAAAAESSDLVATGQAEPLLPFIITLLPSTTPSLISTCCVSSSHLSSQPPFTRSTCKTPRCLGSSGDVKLYERPSPDTVVVSEKAPERGATYDYAPERIRLRSRVERGESRQLPVRGALMPRAC